MVSTPVQPYMHSLGSLLESLQSESETWQEPYRAGKLLLLPAMRMIKIAILPYRDEQSMCSRINKKFSIIGRAE